MKKLDFLTAAMLMAAAALCVGCRVEQSRGANGGENVNVETPMGGVQVKTDNAGASDVGLKEYPGAVRFRENSHGDYDTGSADVSVGFGSYKMAVKVVTYTTNDSPEKVIEFYRKSLGSYGDVIECRNDRPVGKPEMTSEGLSCENSGKKNLDNINIDDGLSLKAGSRHHQRIVAVEDNGGNGGRTKFALVELQLPNIDAGVKDTN